MELQHTELPNRSMQPLSDVGETVRRMTHRQLIPVFLALTGMCCSLIAQTPGPPTKHTLVFKPKIEDGVVVALFDDDTFKTIAALKAHIATLPRGSEIRYSVSDRDAPGVKEFVSWGELPRYCRDRGIRFITVLVEL